MRVEQQGSNECMLATIAALSNTPLAEVRAAACAKTNSSCWADRNVPFPWDVVRYLMRYYKVKGVSGAPLQGSLAPRSAKRITLDGKGSVVIGAPNKRDAHIMPFEDGLIYDPHDPNNPFPLEGLEKRYPDWTILRVTKARKNWFRRV